MKVLVDEHLPPALAHSLHALFDGEHQIEHVRDKFGTGVTDIKWIETLNADGRWVVISADRRITRNRAEYTAFRQSKLIGFFMSKSVYKSPLVKQTARILLLWDGICEIAERVEGGAMFELPIKSNRIPQLRF